MSGGIFGQVSWLDLFPQAVLFLGACTGHVYLLVIHLNWWYAQPLPRKLLSNLKKLSALLAIAGAVLFWAVFGFDLTGALRLASLSPGAWLLAVYLWLCWAIGLVWLPAVTLWRLLRPRPRALLSNHTQTVNIAERLGYAPLGQGKARHLARLPGNQVFQVDFTERTLRLPRLPAAWDGLTILHLTDLHLVGTPDKVFYQHVLDLCQEWHPDLVAITGDIVDSPHHHRWIVPILGRLRWKVAAFAVLGNHDSYHDPNLVRRRLRRLHIHVPGNGWERIDVKGEPLLVIGHEGPWFRPGPDLSACPAGPFRLCLSHTPDNIPWARRHGIDLMLSGHNHGGQIRFPVLGSIFVPSRFSRGYDCGVFEEPPTLLHVGRGLGGKEPLRFHCRPEVTHLVLRR